MVDHPEIVQANLADQTGSIKEDDPKDSSVVSINSPPSKKQRKARTAFTDNQLQTLEKSFERQKYLSVQDRMELATKLHLTDTQVKTWYQNRSFDTAYQLETFISYHTIYNEDLCLLKIMNLLSLIGLVYVKSTEGKYIKN
ncbi:hypothetical protein PV325_011627 [Microctonus aethiopoides]|nr:hypothetical protein PV325_011627 [Microctonus aethiopoides]